MHVHVVLLGVGVVVRAQMLLFNVDHLIVLLLMAVVVRSVWRRLLTVIVIRNFLEHVVFKV